MKAALYFAISAGLLAQQPGVPQDPEKARLEGQVVNGISGEPLRKARLTMRLQVAGPQGQRQQQQPPPATTVTTDSAGKYVFANLEPGDYLLTARRDGFADTVRGAASFGRKTDLLLLGRGDKKTDYTVKMTPFGLILGRVTDEDGDPVRNLGITAMSYRYTNAGRELVDGRSAMTDDLGEYRLFDVPPGKYVLKAAPRGIRLSSAADDAETYAATYYPGAAQASAAAPQEVAAGQQLRGINFTVRKTRTVAIRGRIIAPPDATSVSVGIMIQTQNGSSSTSNSVQDKTGKFELFGVAPGLTYITGDYTVAGLRHTAQVPVEVGSTDISGLELRPLPPMEVTGQVRIEGESAAKLSQVQIALQGRRGMQSVGPKEDGSILLRQVQAGPYTVAANNLQTLYLKSVHWGTAEITDGELDITNGVPPRMELSIVLGTDGGEVWGVVTNEKSEPVEGAMVTLVPRGTHRSRPFFRTGMTDAAGKFTFRGIAPNTYKVFAWDQVNNNAVLYDPDFLRPFEASGQTVQVQPGGKHITDLKIIINKEQ